MATTYNLIDGIPNPKDLVADDVLKFQQTGWFEKEDKHSNADLNQAIKDNMAITKEITLPAGQYKLECWGAQGSNGPSNLTNNSSKYPAPSTSYQGGAGGYSSGIINLTKSTKLFLYPGGCPLVLGFFVQNSGVTESISSGGFNGGINGNVLNCWTGSESGYLHLGHGGGGTDIRIGQDSLYARVIVAGGGGGAPYGGNVFNYSYGGGLTGGAYSSQGVPGGQTVELTDEEKEKNPEKYFGKAEYQKLYQGTTYDGYMYVNGVAGSGGGWYGGTSYPVAYSGYASGFFNTNLWTARCSAGGSGYVYTSSTASNYPSGCLLNSSYYLTDAQTIAGNQSFPSFDASANETGHKGMGAIRITVLDISSKFNVYIKANNIWKQADSAYIKNNSGVWVPTDSIHVKNHNSWS